MIIEEALDTLKTEMALKRTPCGRPINENTVELIKAAISDQKNWGSEVKKCLNCCIIVSSLLVPRGCPNCGNKDMTNDI